MSDPAISAAFTARLVRLVNAFARLMQQLDPATAAVLRDWAQRAADAAPRVPPPLPIDALARAAGLSGPEQDLLLLAGLPDEHESLADAVRRVHPLGLARPTPALAARLLDPATDLRGALTEGAAVRSGILALTGDGPFQERSLVPAPYLWEALHGADAWPPTPARVVTGSPPPGLDRWVTGDAARRAVECLVEERPRVILIPSGDEPIALSRVARLCAAAGRTPVAARMTAGDTSALRLLAVHAAARGAVPVALLEHRVQEPAVAFDPGSLPRPVIVCAAPGTILPPPGRAVVPVPLGPVGLSDRRAAWAAALPSAPERAADLAGRHPLDPAVTAQVARDINGHDDPLTPPPSNAGIAAVIRARAGIVLPPGADLRQPRAGWDDLVLGERSRALLRAAVARLDHQARVLDDWGLAASARADRGVRLLLTGPPGTGKSLAADVLARAASTDLLVIDVSRVVSKWIGETEKNLAAIFDVAERTQAVLLLDEADGLFATRTDVGDAQDRYANLQTAWLLQRLDHFDGLAVLTTNLRQLIDAAFVRRMDYVVEFAQPDRPERLAIWQRHLPPARRAPDLDLAMLATRYPMPGAWIRNAAVGAAFAAASRGGEAVADDDAVTAVAREYAKASKPFPGRPAASSGPVDERAARALAARARRGQEAQA